VDENQQLLLLLGYIIGFEHPPQDRDILQPGNARLLLSLVDLPNTAHNDRVAVADDDRRRHLALVYRGVVKVCLSLSRIIGGVVLGLYLKNDPVVQSDRGRYVQLKGRFSPLDGAVTLLVGKDVRYLRPLGDVSSGAVEGDDFAPKGPSPRPCSRRRRCPGRQSSSHCRRSGRRLEKRRTCRSKAPHSLT